MFKDKSLFTTLLPVAVFFLCTAVIYLFFVEMFPVNYDDCLYNALLKNHSVLELVQMMSGKYSGQYLCHFDGRVFSNVFLLIVFSVIKTHVSVYFIYTLCMLLLLATSFYSFFNSLMRKGVLSVISNANKIVLSFFSACLLFIFVIDGRFEVFYWVSSTGNHLLSIILFLFSLRFFLSAPTVLSTLLFSVLAFCIGQMNEVYATSYLFVFLFTTFYTPKARIPFLLVCTALLIGLLLNVFAPGTLTRVNTLSEYSTHFNLFHSLKITVATIWQPFINWRYLPIKISVALLFFFFLRNYLKLHLTLPEKSLLIFNRLLLFVSVLGIFLHCYILGEICFYRCLLFYCISLMYFVFLMASRNTLNPIKLFFK